MAHVNPIAADDGSDFTFFQLFTGERVVNVSIACELVDRIAGEKLGQPRRLQFLRDQSGLFSSAAEQKLRAVGMGDGIEPNESDFPESALQGGGTA